MVYAGGAGVAGGFIFFLLKIKDAFMEKRTYL